MNRTAFVILRDDKYIIGVCSTREKVDRALEILNTKNEFDCISYSYEEYDLDKLTIFL